MKKILLATSLLAALALGAGSASAAPLSQKITQAFTVAVVKAAPPCTFTTNATASQSRPASTAKAGDLVGILVIDVKCPTAVNADWTVTPTKGRLSTVANASDMNANNSLAYVFSVNGGNTAPNVPNNGWTMIGPYQAFPANAPATFKAAAKKNTDAGAQLFAINNAQAGNRFQVNVMLKEATKPTSVDGTYSDTFTITIG